MSIYLLWQVASLSLPVLLSESVRPVLVERAPPGASDSQPDSGPPSPSPASQSGGKCTELVNHVALMFIGDAYSTGSVKWSVPWQNCHYRLGEAMREGNSLNNQLFTWL